jgi:hypothetical protein
MIHMIQELFGQTLKSIAAVNLHPNKARDEDEGDLEKQGGDVQIHDGLQSRIRRAA